MTHLDELLSAYLDGETSPAESARVDQHLRECLRCRRSLIELNAARTAVRSLPTLELPAVFLPQQEATPFRRRKSVWMGAAAAVAAGVITVATLLTPASEPLDLSDVNRQLGARASLDTGPAPFKVVFPTGGIE